MAEFTPGAVVPMDSRTRTTLLERLRDGSDLVAWQEFFDRYWSLIFTFARRRGCSEHTAEEVVQDVMLRIFEQKDLFRYDPQQGRFRSWLGRLVRNRVVDLRRKPSERVRAAGGEPQEAPAEMASDADAADEDWEAAFEQALLLALLDVLRREMSPRAYLAFELVTLHGLSGAKAARHTGLTRNGVYRAKNRALTRLRELGAAYRRDGQLAEHLKEALRLRPDAQVERSVCSKIEQTMRSAWESSGESRPGHGERKTPSPP